MVEGYPAEVCSSYIRDVLETEEVTGYSRGSYRFGQYSDDSQLARELLQSYVACRRFDPADYAARIAAIFLEHRIVGQGRATEEAAWRLIQGVPWEEAGTPPPAAGNGSAMRAGPIGLLFFDDPQGLLKAAQDQGRITHQDRRCSAGAAAIAGAVALALQDSPIERDRFLMTLAGWVSTIEQTMAEALERLLDWTSLPPKEALRLISQVGQGPGTWPTQPGITPFVISSVLWSLYAFLQSPDDYKATIHTAIAVGGDVDTTAAMAGAISGAHVGLQGIPDGLARHLTDQGTWGLDDLIWLAFQCHAIKLKGP